MKTQKPVKVELTTNEITIIRTGILLLKSKLTSYTEVNTEFDSIVTLGNKLTKALEQIEFERLAAANRNK